MQDKPLVTEYKVLQGAINTIFPDNDIAILVNRHLTNGWELYGPIQSVNDGGTVKYFQAMVKHNK